jgi:chromosome partitioning protein
MIISIASQKGGVGKTSTAISMASGLARKGKKTLIIDIDSQSNTSKVLAHEYPKIPVEQTIHATIINRNPLPIHASKIPNLYIVPSHILLSNTDIALTTAIDHREARLKAELEKISHEYDFVIIDCPPTLSWLTINALTASDQVIVVISPGYFELDSISQIGKTIQEVRDNFNPQLELMGFLFNMSDPTVNTSTSLQILRQTHTDKVLKTIIPRNTDLKNAHFQLQDIFSYNPNAKSAQAYERLIHELFDL